MSLAAPLRYTLFRRIWLASLLSNMGQFIQIVGASWAMAQLTASAELVALVQTSSMLPIMLLALPAGALADSCDRRTLALLALLITTSGAIALSILAALDSISPASLLSFSLAIGIGMALFGPSWQASVREQVPARVLPAAIALRSISFNVGRSAGPAIGGLVVAAGGALAAFVTAAFFYLPLTVMLYLWRANPDEAKDPPEPEDKGFAAALALLIRDSTIGPLLLRAALTGFAGSSVAALMPLIARDLLGAGPQTYGTILTALGIGAIAGGSLIAAARARLHGSALVGLSSTLFAGATLIAGHSESLVLTAAALFLGGAAWMFLVAYLNINIQLFAPNWVAGRAVATFQASISGGIALGSWQWGLLAAHHGTSASLSLSAAAMLLLAVGGRWLRSPPKPLSG